jgi:peptidoglycan/LPS O-acetylase OafA/YrhL
VPISTDRPKRPAKSKERNIDKGKDNMATTTLRGIETAPAPASAPAPAPLVSISISYLRAFVTLLVVAHHSFLVYITMKSQFQRSASFTANPRLWMLFPVSDPTAWSGFDLFVAWNDVFFMPLMFLVSGLFVWSGLTKWGAVAFLKRRLLRVGLPFLVAAAVLGPLTYYPAYMQFGSANLLSYAKAWLSLGNWPSGPAWFLWVLLAFDCLAALCFIVVPRFFDFLRRVFGQTGQRPVRFFFAVVAFSQLAYLPLVWKLGPFGPLMFGPFFVQGTKLLVYFLYFCVGVGAGMFGINTGLFERTGRLARRWPLWTVFSLVCFAGWIGAYVAGKTWVASTIFSFSCAATSLFVIAVFVRFAKSSRLVDSFSANAYGIYILHYAFLAWVQYALVRLAVPAVVKGLLALLCTAVISWSASALLRRSRKIVQVI